MAYILVPVVSRQCVPPCFTPDLLGWSHFGHFSCRPIYMKVCLGGYMKWGLSCTATKIGRGGRGGGVGGGQWRSNVLWSKNTVHFSLLSKRKCGSVSFNPARCQTGILSAPPQRLVSEYLRGHKRATCCSAIDCVKRVTVWVSACVRACVQGLWWLKKWCACSDCILWPSALNK